MSDLFGGMIPDPEPQLDPYERRCRMREDLTDVYYARDQADWEARQVPDNEGWTPDPMRQPTPEDIADNRSDTP